MNEWMKWQECAYGKLGPWEPANRPRVRGVQNVIDCPQAVPRAADRKIFVQIRLQLSS